MNVVNRLLTLPLPLLKLDSQWPASRIRTLRIVVEAVLGVAIAVQGILTGLQIGHVWAKPTVVPVASPPGIRTARADSSESAALIARAHLFGEVVTASTDEASSEIKSAPSQWLLTGTLAGREPRRGFAILGSENAATHFFAVGDQVGTGIQLVQVFTDRVILKRSGTLMAVMMKHAVAGGGTFVGDPQQVGMTDRQEKGSSAEDERPPTSILADALLKPEAWVDPASGNYGGMTLPGKANRANLNKYGFKDEDVITAVNGRKISSFGASQKALKDMSNGAPATVTVLRDGVPQQLSVTLVDDGNTW